MAVVLLADRIDQQQAHQNANARVSLRAAKIERNTVDAHQRGEIPTLSPSLAAAQCGRDCPCSRDSAGFIVTSRRDRMPPI
jgi:hypothetical protein